MKPCASRMWRSLYGDSKSALALRQGDVGAWRTRHLRLRAAGLRAAVGCEVSGWYTHHVKGTELPADGLTKQLLRGIGSPVCCSTLCEWD